MKLSILLAFSLSIVSILLISACVEEDDPVPISGCTDIKSTNYNPSAEVDDGSCLMACEANQTASVRFTNLSSTSSTHDVIWDGSKIATVIPGDTTEYFTVTANIEHTLQFKFTNSSDPACNESKPIIAQCSFQTYWCTG